MDIHSLVPKDKGDIETAKRLKNVSYKEIKPIIPELLAWIQDMNWPIARVVGEYLQSIAQHITKDIINILRGDDEIWKYWCLSVFAGNGVAAVDPVLIEEIKRIAEHPTAAEIHEKVHERAKNILRERHIS